MTLFLHPGQAVCPSGPQTHAMGKSVPRGNEQDKVFKCGPTYLRSSANHRLLSSLGRGCSWTAGWAPASQQRLWRLHGLCCTVCLLPPTPGSAPTTPRALLPGCFQGPRPLVGQRVFSGMVENCHSSLPSGRASLHLPSHSLASRGQPQGQAHSPGQLCRPAQGLPHILEVSVLS